MLIPIMTNTYNTRIRMKESNMNLGLNLKNTGSYWPDVSMEDSQSVLNPEWCIPEISRYTVEGLRNSFNNHRKLMSAGELFAIFLAGSFNYTPEPTPDIETFYIQALLESARRGFVPAQAVLSKVFASYALSWPLEISGNMVRQWLFNGASTGSILALADLRNVDACLAESAAHMFHERGGYNQHHVGRIPTNEMKTATLEKLLEMDPNDTDKLELCSCLAVHANSKALHELLGTIKIPINASSWFGVPPLYLACQTGSVEAVRVLCRNGADASIAEQPRGITCLHWLFNFPTENIQEVAGLLLDHGGKPNAMARKPYFNHHFPFKWPPGSPLHWAVTARNVTAVTTLLSVGADASLRNQDDPYVTDMNVRYIEAEAQPGQGGYSFPVGPVAGLSMLDMAVANYDWQTLRAISPLQNKTVDISQTDEEGYTPFHRLEYNWVGRDFFGSRFWYPAFDGSPASRESNIRQTIEVLQAMGGQVDVLTKSLDYTTLVFNRWGNMTPLMLAVRKGDLHAIVALLQCGADPNIRNDQGITALGMFPESKDPEVKAENLPLIAQILLDNGASPVIHFPSRRTPLAAAVYSSLDVVDMLLAAGGRPTEHVLGLNVIAMLLDLYCILDTIPWHNRAYLSSVEHQVKYIIQKHVLSCFPAAHPGMLEQVDEQGGTLLHYAAYAGFLSVVKVLLEAGAKPSVFREYVTYGKQYRKDRLRTDIIHKTPQEEMLYNNYLW